jgi:hypothetical protein
MFIKDPDFFSSWITDPGVKKETYSGSETLEKIQSQPVEGLNPAEELLIVPTVDENLRVVLHTVRQHSANKK